MGYIVTEADGIAGADEEGGTFCEARREGFKLFTWDERIEIPYREIPKIRAYLDFVEKRYERPADAD